MTEVYTECCGNREGVVITEPSRVTECGCVWVWFLVRFHKEKILELRFGV